MHSVSFSNLMGGLYVAVQMQQIQMQRQVQAQVQRQMQAQQATLQAQLRAAQQAAQQAQQQAEQFQRAATQVPPDPFFDTWYLVILLVLSHVGSDAATVVCIAPEGGQPHFSATGMMCSSSL